MNRGEIEKLLGGYATGTLSDRERRALLEAALEDQELFNALGDEEALRELLADPVSLSKVRAALEPARQTGWFSRPLAWSLAGSCAAVVLTVGIAWRLLDTEPALAPAEMARLGPPQTAGPIESVPAPVPRQESVPPAARKDTAARQTKPAAVQPRAETQARAEAERADVARPAEARWRAPAPRQPESVEVAVGPAGAERAVVQMRSAVPSSASTLLSVARPHPGLDYKILRRTDAGLWVETPPGTAFKPGDAVRLSIVSRYDAVLEVRQRTGDGVWRPVSVAGPQRIRAGAVRTLPPAGEFRFEDSPMRFSITLTPDGAAPAVLEISLPAAR